MNNPDINSQIDTSTSSSVSHQDSDLVNLSTSHFENPENNTFASSIHNSNGDQIKTNDSKNVHFSSIINPDSSSPPIYATLNLLTLGIVCLVYYNYLMVKPFFSPLFYAILCSVALHKIKESILQYFFKIDQYLEQKEKDYSDRAFTYRILFRTINVINLLYNDIIFVSIHHQFVNTSILNKIYQNFIYPIFSFFFSFKFAFCFSILTSFLLFIFKKDQFLPNFLSPTPFYSLFIFFLIIWFLVVFRWSSSIYNNLLTIFIIVSVLTIILLFASVILFNLLDEFKLLAQLISLFVEDNRRFIDQALQHSDLQSHLNHLLSTQFFQDLNEQMKYFSQFNPSDFFNKPDDVNLNITQIVNHIQENQTIQKATEWNWIFTHLFLYIYHSIQYITSIFGVSLHYFLTLFLSLFLYIVGFGMDFLLFIAALYYLLLSNQSFVTLLGHLLPFSFQFRRHIIRHLEANIQGIFLISLKIALFHSFLTYLSFRICSLEFAFLAGFLSGFFTLVPLLSSWLVFLPAIITLYIRHHFISMVFLILFRLILSWFDPYFYSNTSSQLHPYWTGLSIVMGLGCFGLQGIILGPLIMVLSFTAYSIFSFDNQDRSFIPTSQS